MPGVEPEESSHGRRFPESTGSVLPERRPMADETDVDPEKKWLAEERARVVVKNLQRRHINARYFATRTEAREAILGMIPPWVTVARGDSITVDQVGILPELVKRQQNTILDPFRWDADGYYIDSETERRRMKREAFSADVFLAGSNAVTLDGKLVNIDGLGNRVAPMVYGPDRVILVVGTNKIVTDVDEALERIHQVAAPMNARRHYLRHHEDSLADLPCVRTGRCVDCTHDEKICCYTVIIEGTMSSERDRLHVVLVGEELGI